MRYVILQQTSTGLEFPMLLPAGLISGNLINNYRDGFEWISEGYFYIVFGKIHIPCIATNDQRALEDSKILAHHFVFAGSIKEGGNA